MPTALLSRFSATRCSKEAFLLAVALLFPLPALAEADGPDHFRVKPSLTPRVLLLRAEPASDAALAGLIPAQATCLRNLGCRGGPDIAAFTAAASAEKALASAPPRWCRLESKGLAGWLEGSWLTEGNCPSGHKTGPSIRRLSASLKGRDDRTLTLALRAGQTLRVSLSGRHPQTFFNVQAPGGDSAWFTGMSAGNRFEGIAPQAGEYRIVVFLGRAAARRNARSTFTLEASVLGDGLSPLAGSKDALISGTAFHATAEARCYDGRQSLPCAVQVTRYDHERTATVFVQWPAGMAGLPHAFLLAGGTLIATDSPLPVTLSTTGDRRQFTVEGGSTFVIPDVFLTGD